MPTTALQPAAPELGCQRQGRRRWWLLGGFLALAVILVAVHRPLLTHLAGILIAPAPKGEFDYVWLRSGDGICCDGDRAYDAAAGWCRKSPTRRIVLVEPEISRLVRYKVWPPFATIAPATGRSRRAGRSD